MKYVLFILILMLGIFVQGVAGFGGTLISMPLGIMVMGMATTKPVMTIVAWIAAVIVVFQDFRYIQWKELAKMVGVMLLGVLGGLWVSGKIQMNFLLIIYGAVVFAIGVKKLLFKQKRKAPPFLQNIALILAGIMQGLFVSGGSFLAVYAVEKVEGKREFRVTVNAVWAIVNTVMIATFFTSGVMTREVLTMSGISVLPTLGTVWLSGLMTKHVKQSTFLKIIYIVLIISGIILLVTNI